MKKNTAILYFAQSPLLESARKKLSPNKEKNAALWRLLYHKSRQIALQTGLPFIDCPAGLQSGKNFGERLVNALQSQFDNGYDYLIVMGADCPAIRSEDILQLCEVLNHTSRVATMPDERGGVALLALHRSAFDRTQLLGMAWQSAGLLSDLQMYGAAYGYHELRQTVRDVHFSEDINALHHTSATLRYFTSYLYRFLRELQLFFRTGNEVMNFANARRLLPLRAPPALA